jgi:hypothetical protein
MWMTDTTDFCGMGIEDLKGKSWRSREGEKDSVYPIGDGEKQKARSLSKKGAHDGT